MSVSSMSSRTNCPGCSDWADRTRPHIAACSRSPTPSPGSASTAPRVTSTSRDPASRSSAIQAWIRRSVRTTVVRAASAASPSGPVGTGAHTRTTSVGTGSGTVSRRNRSSRSWSRSGPGSRSVAGQPGRSSPRTTVRPPDGIDGRGHTGHSTRLRSPPEAMDTVAVRTSSGETGRSAREPTVRAGAPVASVACRETVSVPSTGVIRTRSRSAPGRCTWTSLQENGSRPVSPSPSAKGPRPRACRALSSSAGCRPNRPASVSCPAGSCTSARRSWPCRQAARSPRKQSPYWKSASARRT
ncbi:hypothetical protein Sgri01_07157 [Streptomyces griseus]